MRRAIRSGLCSVLAFLQLGVNLALFSITASHLVNQNGSVCLVGNEWKSMKYCNYTYIIAGVGIGVYFFIYVFQAFDNAFCNAFKNMLLCFLSAWYAVGAGIITYSSINLPDVVPQDQWRTSVWALLWSNLGLTIVISGVSNGFSEKGRIRDHEEGYVEENRPY